MANGDKANVSPNLSSVVSEMERKPRHICTVLQGRQGEVLRLRACV